MHPPAKPFQTSWILLNTLAGPRRTRLLSGTSGAGKTTQCAQWCAAATAKGKTVCGTLCPGIWHNGHKTAIRVQNLYTGTDALLATWNPNMNRWDFSPNGIAFGNAAYTHPGRCDLLCVDELGPLELRDGLGWQKAIRALRTGAYTTAIVVVRTTLLPLFFATLNQQNPQP